MESDQFFLKCCGGYITHKNGLGKSEGKVGVKVGSEEDGSGD